MTDTQSSREVAARAKPAEQHSAADPGPGTAPSPTPTPPPAPDADRDAQAPTPTPPTAAAPDAALSAEPASGLDTDRPRAPASAAESEVAREESFRTVAEGVLANQAGDGATDAQVAAYWSTLVTANAHRLVESGNEDLLLVGQQITVRPPA